MAALFLGTSPQSITVASGTNNKRFCYHNDTAGTYVISVQVQVDGKNIGDPASITLTITTPPSLVTPSITLDPFSLDPYEAGSEVPVSGSVTVDTTTDKSAHLNLYQGVTCSGESQPFTMTNLNLITIVTGSSPDFTYATTFTAPSVPGTYSMVANLSTLPPSSESLDISDVCRVFEVIDQTADGDDGGSGSTPDDEEDSPLVPLTICKYDDESEAPIAGWNVTVFNDATSTQLVTGANGCVTTDVDVFVGPWKVIEELPAGWEQVEVTSDGSGSAVEEFETESGLVDGCVFPQVPRPDVTVSELEPITGERIDSGLVEGVLPPPVSVDPNPTPTSLSCYFYNRQIPTKPVKMCKLDEFEQPIAGWKMDLYTAESEIPATYETLKVGCVTVEVPESDFPVRVYEEERAGWTQVSAWASGEGASMLPIDPEGEEEEYPRYCTVDNVDDYIFDLARVSSIVSVFSSSEPSGATCSFMNEGADPKPEDPVITTTPRRSSSGTRIRPKASAPTPLVLGASTNTPQFCPFLKDYMQMKTVNDPMEVMKLQTFLNIFRNMFGGNENPVTGVFDEMTEMNVKAFQAHFKDEVLTPWYERGIVPHNQPTGFVYKTTLWKINSIVCPEYAVTPDYEGEDLTTNIKIR